MPSNMAGRKATSPSVDGSSMVDKWKSAFRMTDREYRRKLSGGCSNDFIVSIKPVHASKAAPDWDYPSSNISSRVMAAGFGPGANWARAPASISLCRRIQAKPSGRCCNLQKSLVGLRRVAIVFFMVHAGIGYDVHPLVEGRKLILGGVDIAHGKGLDGHSDADVLMHAICDAVLGALGEADIGHFFPNTDPRWHGVPSKIFLHEAARLTGLRDGKLVNIDATVIAQAPKIFPHAQKMKFNIAEALGINLQLVGIKATTNEHLGFIGREEGIAALAVASVDLPLG